ncbi:MAG TPA: DUF6034 family protein [Clostridia bacterium]|nr:DUF6034 family protein [Clostridia bacterium]
MRRKISLVIVLLISFLLAACQPTPDEVFIIEKDTGRMMEKASSDENGTVADALGLPGGNYTFEITDTSGRVKVSVDAEMITPDVDYLPIARVTGRSFTEQDVENIYNALCDGATPVSEDAPMPKPFYQQTLDGLLELRDSGNLDKYDSVEDLDAAIQEVMAQVASAPEHAVPIVLNSSFNSSGIARILCVQNDATVSDLFVINSTQTERGVYSDFIRDVFNRTEFAHQSAYGQAVTVSYALTRDANIILPQISEREALAKAEQVISTLGLDDFTCTGRRIAPLFDAPTAEVKAACKSVYEFMFTRSVNGVNVTYTNDILSSPPNDPNTVSEPWMYEKIRMFVDDHGIYAYMWNAPCTVTEILNDKATLLPFDQIKKIFANMILVKYGDYIGDDASKNISINITQIQLGLARVTEQDNNAYGLLVPVWDFFGTYDEGIGYPIGLDGYESLLTINAVDGSIIDRSKGY